MKKQTMEHKLTPGEIRQVKEAHLRNTFGLKPNEPMPHPVYRSSPSLAEADRLRRVAYHS